MAVVTNTWLSTAAAGNRQEIDDIVSRITPEDTPIYSMIGKGKTRSTSPEWETDTLRAPAANAQAEGDEYTFAAITAAVRLKNHTQILRQGWVVSNTQEAVNNVGNVEKAAEKKVKSGVELRKDVELSIVSNTASVASTTRVSGGLPSWIATNLSRNGGTAGGYSSGTGLTVAAVNGTQRAFTKALMDTVMGSVYQSGGNVRSMVCSPYIKSVFVTFMSDTNVAPFRYSVTSGGGKNTIIGTADAYDGPFGKINVVPNRVMYLGGVTVARNVFFIDPDLLEWTWLRPMQEDPNLAKTHDAVKGMIIGEGTLKVRNEAGLGMVADVFGTTAST